MKLLKNALALFAVSLFVLSCTAEDVNDDTYQASFDTETVQGTNGAGSEHDISDRPE